MSGEFLNMRTKDGTPFMMLNLVDFRFIIESATFGMFRGFVREERSNKYGPRWLSVDQDTRSNPEVWSTTSVPEAMSMIERVMEHDPKAYLVRMCK